MSGNLRVDTALLHELSAKQAQVAGDLSSATELVEGVSTSLRVTHGPISSSTADAVEAALRARRAAGAGMVRASWELGDGLRCAATRYDRTDATMSDVLDGTVR
ncbi:ESX-1 secretion-associated protein [Mycolicibacterium setense]